MTRGQSAVEAAKGSGDYKDAIVEFEQAIKLASDWPDAYFNLGMVQGTSGNFDAAIVSFKKYLELSPDASDAREVKDRIYDYEYKTELAKKEQNKFNDLLGTWDCFDSETGQKVLHEYIITAKGKELEVKLSHGYGWIIAPAQFDGQKLKFRYTAYLTSYDQVYDFDLSVVSQNLMKGYMNSEVVRTNPGFPVKVGRKGRMPTEFRKR